ncbi:unnamed protein product [Urochloa humidicola]
MGSNGKFNASHQIACRRAALPHLAVAPPAEPVRRAPAHLPAEHPNERIGSSAPEEKDTRRPLFRCTPLRPSRPPPADCRSHAVLTSRPLLLEESRPLLLEERKDDGADRCC